MLSVPAVDRLGNVNRVQARTRLAETTVAIRRLVLEGLLPTGSRFSDTEIAQALGVSRPTVREAVRQLVHEGLLVHEPYRGLRVATIDDQSLLDLASVRTALETLAASRIAASLPGAALEPLERCILELEKARRAGDGSALHDAHFRFHRAVHVSSGIDVLPAMWDVLESRIRLALRIDLEVRPDFDRVVADHRAFLDFIRLGDLAAIGAGVADHIRRSAAAVVERRRRG